MVTRRRFLCAAAAGAAMLSRMSNVLAATFDLIVKGGRVIDPSLGIDAVRDVAVAGGRIAAVEENIAADATETIDARGKIVVPGLVDIHSHAARTKEGPPLCLLDGVTGYVDAGSFGADGIDQGAANVKAGPNLGRLLINIARTGVAPGGELHDLSRADVSLARRAAPLRATATSSSASRRGCRTTSPTPATSKRSGAPRKRPLPSICR